MHWVSIFYAQIKVCTGRSTNTHGWSCKIELAGLYSLPYVQNPSSIISINVNNPFLSLILPAHNEEQRILSCLENVNDFLGIQEYSCEILIVENASVDKTLEIANDFARRNKKFHVIHLDDPGKGLQSKQGCLPQEDRIVFLRTSIFPCQLPRSIAFSRPPYPTRR